MKKIAILCATLNNNMKLSQELEKILIEKKAEVDLISLEQLDLPLYTPTLEKKGIPEKVLELTERMKAAQGFILTAPEYNGSIPPVMVNAINWVSRSGEEDWRAAFNNKVAVVGTHSGGGGLKVCQDMRGQLEHLGVNVLARPIITNFQKTLNPESANDILNTLLKFIEA